MEVAHRPKPTPSKPFRFMDLPAELRNRIYELALSSSSPIRSSITTSTTMRHFWYLAPSTLYAQKPFMGLTQACRTIRTEFPPARYHEQHHQRQRPAIAFHECAKYLRAFPFMARNLGVDVTASLAALDAGVQRKVNAEVNDDDDDDDADIDILPLVRTNWATQPFTLFWRREKATSTPSNRALHIASYLVERMGRSPDAWADVAALKIGAAVGLVVVKIELLEGGVGECDMDFEAKKGVVDRVLRWSGVLRCGGVQALCRWGEFEFKAEGQRQVGRAKGGWTRGGRRCGRESYY